MSAILLGAPSGWLAVGDVVGSSVMAVLLLAIGLIGPTADRPPLA